MHFRILMTKQSEWILGYNANKRTRTSDNIKNWISRLGRCLSSWNPYAHTTTHIHFVSISFSNKKKKTFPYKIKFPNTFIIVYRISAGDTAYINQKLRKIECECWMQLLLPPEVEQRSKMEDDIDSIESSATIWWKFKWSKRKKVESVAWRTMFQWVFPQRLW